MSFVFDTSFRILRHYYPNRFPPVWAGLELVTAGEITSTREVFNELERFDYAGRFWNGPRTTERFFFPFPKMMKPISSRVSFR